MHGTYSHRLLFYVLCAAIEQEKLILQYGNGKELTAKQLLELLVSVQWYQSHAHKHFLPNSVCLWTLLMDTVMDMTHTDKSPMPEQFIFSCRSPFVLNSLLSCFGRELGLENLWHYLLNSFWKAAFKMVCRASQHMREKNIPYAQLYTYCIEVLSTNKTPAAVFENYPFTLTVEEAMASSSYEPFTPDGPRDIVKRRKSERVAGEYPSWGAFFEKQQTANVVLAKRNDDGLRLK